MNLLSELSESGRSLQQLGLQRTNACCPTVDSLACFPASRPAAIPRQPYSTLGPVQDSQDGHSRTRATTSARARVRPNERPDGMAAAVPVILYHRQRAQIPWRRRAYLDQMTELASQEYQRTTMQHDQKADRACPDAKDIGQAVIKGLLGAVPFVGSGLVEFLELYVQSSSDKRRDRFITSIAEGLDDLRREGRGFSSRRLVDHPTFAPFVLGSIQLVLTAIEQEKATLLRNAALNIAIDRAPSADQQQLFRNLIGSLTVSHIHALAFFADPRPARPGQRLQPSSLEESASDLLLAVVPPITSDRDLARYIVRDLVGKSLLAFPTTPPSFLGPGEGRIYELTSSCLSPLGQRFMEFISDPRTPGQPSTGDHA